METTKLTVTLTMLEEMLGTAPSNKEIYSEYIQSEASPDETETLPVDQEIAKGTTVFHRMPDGKTPAVYDYQIKGFFKDACGSLTRVGDSKSKKLKAYKKEIDGLIFVQPRLIALDLRGGKVGICERPLRAQTAQGERVALARSETIPVGSIIKFDICLLDERLYDYVLEWLEYGKLRGLGQWRNSGKGRFLAEHTVA